MKKTTILLALICFALASCKRKYYTCTCNNSINGDQKSYYYGKVREGDATKLCNGRYNLPQSYPMNYWACQLSYEKK